MSRHSESYKGESIGVNSEGKLVKIFSMWQVYIIGVGCELDTIYWIII